MSKKPLFQPFIMLFTALALMTALLGLYPATATQAQTSFKIMALGDSITGSPGCWRALLWNRLTANGYTNFTPVGTLSPAGCPNDNSWHEGHGGILATGIANGNQLPPWLAATTPDVVVMHLGTNDSFSATNTVSMILAAYTTMVGQMRASNPNMKILVAQIIPLYSPTGQCTDCWQRVVDLNNAIPAWAAGLTTAQSPITVVDQWTGFNATTDTGDGIHPNDLGLQKISDKWYPALVAVLGGTPLPTATKTFTPAVVTNTPTRTNTPVTPVITPTRTNTTGPTATRTRTPTAGPTSTRTRTPTSGPSATRTNTPVTPVVSATPTRTQAPITATPTSGSGTTCTPVSATITAPFTYDGAGTFCWQSTNLGTYMNSWNTASVSINGVNITNLYVASGSYPAKIGGFWYVSYNAPYAWSHFEAK